jgi:hypothetical protein
MLAQFEISPLNLWQTAAARGRRRFAMGVGRFRFGQELAYSPGNAFLHIGPHVLKRQAKAAA